MARMNTARTAASARSPITSTPAVATTHEGAQGYARDPRSEVFLGAVSSLNEDSFYETAIHLRERLGARLETVAVEDPAWVENLVHWLRYRANLRSIAVVVAALAVKVRLDAGQSGHNRAIIAASIRRADEPGEVLAFWRAEVSPTVPSAVKRGVADGLRQTLNERSWLKWRGRGERGDYRFADLLNLVHPRPKDEAQDALFSHIIDTAYGRKPTVPESLQVLTARKAFLSMDESDQRALVLSDDGSERLRAAGITWEALSGILPGGLGAREWEAVIPNLGYQALMMNLRNFEEQGVSDTVLEEVSARLRDRDEVLHARLMPMQFLSAYRNAPMRFQWPLEQGMGHTLENVPALPGRTLILVDCSASMNAPLSARGTLSRMDAASIFGSALALRAQAATLVAYGTDSHVVSFRKADSVLPLSQRFSKMGMTETADAVARHFSGHDRVVNLTDEQAGQNRRGDVYATVPAKTPVFTWNLAGYEYGASPSGSANRHTFGGLSDLGFDLISKMEKGRIENWGFLAQ